MSVASPVQILSFTQLSTDQLYDLLQLRSEVFVVEQNCVYLDIDGLDRQVLHCLRYRGHHLSAYTRLLPPDKEKAGACGIGRVVTSPSVRGLGDGKLIFRDSVTACRDRWPGSDILIHAQSYLLGFYRGFGFTVEGDEFLEDGIPHLLMRLRAGKGEA